MLHDLKTRLRRFKDDAYDYFAVKNWGVNREYGLYVESHREEHGQHPWKHRWMLIRLNWHYRVLRRTDYLYGSGEPKPYLDGVESSLSNRPKAVHMAMGLMKYDVVSFDIFDTLILRPFARPADLFMIVGKRLGKIEFYRIRTDAERRAREKALAEKGTREVTIEDIYAIIEERTGIPRETGIQAELRAELDYCFANPYMKRVYRMLREQGKNIVITSDMYLPHDLMAQILEKAGYTGYDKLYVSCDYGCSKREGGLYQVLKKDYPEKCIVHVGDNAVSDNQAAQDAGLDARQYRSCHEIGNHYRAGGMSALIGSAYVGLVNTYLHNGEAVYSPAYEYGFIYGGLYILGYCNWIHKKAKEEGIDKILFLSRDGTIYQRIFNMMFDDIPNEYFLWSRIANLKYTLPHNREDFLRRLIADRIARREEQLTISALLESVSLEALKPKLSQYGLDGDELAQRENAEGIEAFFIAEWDAVMAAYAGERERVREYILRMVGESRKVAIVDVGWLGSGPMGLKYLIEEAFQLPCKVYCMVAAARPRTDNDINAEFLDETIQPYLFSPMLNRSLYELHKSTNHGKNNIFFELFTQAQHPSFSGFNEKGDCQFDIAEVENYEMIKEIHDGIAAFCELYFNTFKGDAWMMNIDGYDAYSPYKAIIEDTAFIRNTFSKFSYARGISGDQKMQKIVSIKEIMDATGV